MAADNCCISAAVYIYEDIMTFTYDKRFMLADGLYCFRTEDGMMRIVLTDVGKVIDCIYSSSILSLLKSMNEEHSVAELQQLNPSLSFARLNVLLHQLNQLGIIREQCLPRRNIRCLILGVGSAGSHIFQHLSTMPMEHITIVDDDKVDITNLHRQCFRTDDIGKLKVDVLAKESMSSCEVRSVAGKILDDSALLSIVSKDRINIIIQAADMPTSTKMAKMISRVGNYCGIPVIINMGYAGDSVSFPEFYYPNQQYKFATARASRHEALLLRYSKKKASYSACSELGSLVARQIDDYRYGKVPVGYGERGYFNVIEHRWKTTRVANRIFVEPIFGRVPK